MMTTPCDKQQWAPIFMGARLFSQTFSPIQLWAPTSRFQGYFTLTPGLITTPRAIRAPNRRSRRTLMPEEGFKGFMRNRALHKYQRLRTKAPLPGWYQLLS